MHALLVCSSCGRHVRIAELLGLFCEGVIGSASGPKMPLIATTIVAATVMGCGAYGPPP